MVSERCFSCLFCACFVPCSGVCHLEPLKEVAHQEGKLSSGCPRPSENAPRQPPYTPWCPQIQISPRKGGSLGGYFTT